MTHAGAGVFILPPCLFPPLVFLQGVWYSFFARLAITNYNLFFEEPMMTAFLILTLIGLCCVFLSQRLRRPFRPGDPRLWLCLALLVAASAYPLYGLFPV